MGEVWSLLAGAGIGVVVMLAVIIGVSIKLDKIREKQKIKEQLAQSRSDYSDSLFDVRDQSLAGLPAIQALRNVIIEHKPTHLKAREDDAPINFYNQREFGLLLEFCMQLEAKVAAVSDPTDQFQEVLVELREEVAELRTQLDAQA